MQSIRWQHGLAAAIIYGMFCSVAMAKLPPLTPQQQQAADAKKAQAATTAAQQKQQLEASMDALATRWRANAAGNGWKTYPAVTVSAPTPAAAAGGVSAGQTGASAQPGGKLGSTTGNLPIRSEKRGTAPPSLDVKDPSRKGK